MTPDEAAALARGGKWNFQHCNGRFCAAEQVVNGTCGGECRTGQQTGKTVNATKGGQKGKRIAGKGNPAKQGSKVTPRAGGAPTTSKADQRKERSKRRAAQTRADWDGYEESAYQSAESATRGNMQRRGSSSSILGVYWPRGRRPWGAASKELTGYWDGGGMVPVTLTEYKAGRRSLQGRPWSDPDDRPKRGKGKKGRRRGE